MNEDLQQVPDRVGVALASLAAGAAAGAGVVSAGLVLFRSVLHDALPLVLFGGILTAAAIGWILSGPIADTWRRGVTAALAVFGAMMLAGLTAPADMVGGRVGVIVYAAAMLLGAGWAGVTARRAGRT